jgi:hypothetical protein
MLRSADSALAHPSAWAGFVSIGALRAPFALTRRVARPAGARARPAAPL